MDLGNTNTARAIQSLSASEALDSPRVQWLRKVCTFFENRPLLSVVLLFRKFAVRFFSQSVVSKKNSKKRRVDLERLSF